MSTGYWRRAPQTIPHHTACSPFHVRAASRYPRTRRRRRGRPCGLYPPPSSASATARGAPRFGRPVRDVQEVESHRVRLRLERGMHIGSRHPHRGCSRLQAGPGRVLNLSFYCRRRACPSGSTPGGAQRALRWVTGPDAWRTTLQRLVDIPGWHMFFRAALAPRVRGRRAACGKNMDTLLRFLCYVRPPYVRSPLLHTTGNASHKECELRTIYAKIDRYAPP